MLEKNAAIISLKKKLDETKSDSSKVNRTYIIKESKSNQQNIYSNQRVCFKFLKIYIRII